MSVFMTLSHAAPAADLESLAACQAISSNVRSFAFRDQARWEELRDLFTPDGRIAISWYDGPVDGFIAQSKEMATQGAGQTKHLLSEPRITLCGARAVSETDVTIMVRSSAGPIELDVTSYARFLDTFERSPDGIWRIHSRTGIYEKDRMDTVGPSWLFALVYPFLPLSKYPRALRHLAFGLSRTGLPLSAGIILSGSPKETQLKRDAMAWIRHGGTR
jgi:hypothetical protein